VKSSRTKEVNQVNNSLSLSHKWSEQINQ